MRGLAPGGRRTKDECVCSRMQGRMETTLPGDRAQSRSCRRYFRGALSKLLRSPNFHARRRFLCSPRDEGLLPQLPVARRLGKVRPPPLEAEACASGSRVSLARARHVTREADARPSLQAPFLSRLPPDAPISELRQVRILPCLCRSDSACLGV